MGTALPPPLPPADFDAIFARVPRLTVEVVITSTEGVLLTRRVSGPCRGLWHIPGGTVRLGEPLTEAVARVADQELGLDVVAEDLLGYIEYPSHLRLGLGWPVGMAFRTRVAGHRQFHPQPGSAGWFSELPEAMHDEQRLFLAGRLLDGRQAAGETAPAGGNRKP
jgi:ADP-ribose pyrophosphatase YjhB (NUDIX family)